MQILHAFVGYLAVTVLPFGPFAFASPLASATIDHDGYVNTTEYHIDSDLMKQALGIETQNQKDSVHLKHIPGDVIIEARQAAIIIPVVFTILSIVSDVGGALWWIKKDDPKRAAFTQNTINSVLTKYNKFNWVICHSPSSAAFDGQEGTDWGYTYHELTISFERKIGYDLYWAKSGTFYRYGDGGFINWAYGGNVISTDNDGATVHFGVIS